RVVTLSLNQPSHRKNHPGAIQPVRSPNPRPVKARSEPSRIDGHCEDLCVGVEDPHGLIVAARVATVEYHNLRVTDNHAHDGPDSTEFQVRGHLPTVQIDSVRFAVQILQSQADRSKVQVADVNGVDVVPADVCGCVQEEQSHLGQ